MRLLGKAARLIDVRRAWFVGCFAIVALLPAGPAVADGAPPAAAADDPFPAADDPSQAAEEGASSKNVAGPPPAPARRWYGAQTLIVDGGALALVVVARTIRPVYAGEEASTTCVANCSRSAKSASDVLLVTGLGAYQFGAPIVHLTHHHTGKAAASFGLRTLPALLMLAGAGCDPRFCGGGDQVFIGVAVGALVSVADLAFIAHEDVPAAPAPVPAPALVPATFFPWVDVTRQRASVGVGGTF